MFFHFNQNNTGGSFTFDEARGLTHHMVIEAADSSDANTRALELGLYFNGVQDGMDCGCCGDRWYETYSDGDEVPKVYHCILGEKDTGSVWKWMPEGRETCVHYLDGRKVWYNADNTPAEEQDAQRS